MELKTQDLFETIKKIGEAPRMNESDWTKILLKIHRVVNDSSFDSIKEVSAKLSEEYIDITKLREGE